MPGWRRILIIFVLAGGLLAQTDVSEGQLVPPEVPSPFGSPTANSVVPLPSMSMTAPPAAGLAPPVAGYMNSGITNSGIPNAPAPNNGANWSAPANPTNWATTDTGTWSAGQQPYIEPATSNMSTPGLSISSDPLQQPTVTAATSYAQLVQSSWYTRIDYFHWNEHIGALDFVNESGALYTLGYSRRFGKQRFRTEMFGGSMIYDGGLQFDDGTSEPMTSRTRYLGGLVEAEHLIEPSWWSHGAFFVGVGSRFWVRDIRSGFGSLGDFGDETQETWWTFYPYVGLQAAYPLQNGLELYGSMRVGATAATYNFSNAFNLPVYPRPGAMGNVEFGMRGPNLAVSATFGVMSWSRSAQELFSTTDANGNFALSSVFQPSSTMITVGGKVAYSF